MPTILLLKDPTKGEDCYKTLLSSVGDVSSIPVLSFRYINQEQVKSSLSHVEKWNGIIFTSKRGVESVKSCFEESLPQWSSVCCYAVGEATKSAAQKLGFKCQEEESGTAKALAEYIVKDSTKFTKDKSLLFVCGVSKREELPTVLEANNIEWTELVSYETVENAETKSQIEKFVEVNGIPDYLVFFSPSGVKFCFDQWKEIWKSKSKYSKIVSIGPTTTNSLIKRGVEDVITAKFPSPESLLDAIKRVL